MSSNHILPKKELYTVVKRFLDDHDRGISIDLFAELCGLPLTTLKGIFYRHDTPMTERSQIRLSKGYNAWKNGEVRVMQNRDRTRYVEYREKPKPVAVRATGVVVENGKLKIKIGLANPRDYSVKTLDEQLRGNR